MPWTVRQPSPPVTRCALLEAERLLGSPLPPVYKRFLKRHNGGKPSPDNVPVTGVPKNPFVVVDLLYGVGTGRGYNDVVCAALDMRYGIGRQPPRVLIPFAGTPSGQFFMVGIKAPYIDRIYFYDWYGPGYGPWDAIHFVARDIFAFLDTLVTEEEADAQTAVIERSARKTRAGKKR